MAQLPDSLPTADVVGYRPSSDTAGATDFGLGQLGDTLASLAPAQVERKQRADIEAARPLAQQFVNSSEAAYKEEAASYTGDHPGFANDQLTKAQQRATGFVASQKGLPPGQQQALSYLLAQHVNEIGTAAGHYEADKLAAPIAAMTAAQQEAQVGAIVTDAMGQAETQVQQLRLEHQATDTDLPSKVGAVYDATQAQAVAAAPDNLKPYVATQLLKMKLAGQGEALSYQLKQGEAHQIQGFSDQITAATNAVVSTPGAYDNAVGVVLPQILAGAPAGLREDLQRHSMAALAEARVKGLIDQQQIGQAQTELNDGRYDKFLPPETKDRLVARADAESRAHGPEAIAQALQAQSTEAAMSADLYARLTTGRSTGQVNLDTAAAQLSPTRVAEYLTAAKNADRTFAAAGSVHEMATADIHALAAQPQPDPSDPGYADKIQIWQSRQQAAAAELKARANPGQWAYSPSATKAGRAGAATAEDRGAALQQGWSSYLGATPGGDRQQAGRQIARDALGAQDAAGFDRSSWQMIPQTEASRLAATVVNAPPEGKLAALTSLAGVIQDLPNTIRTKSGDFVNPQAIMTRQLLAAHLTPADVAAMADFGSDPAKLGRYVAAVNDPTLKAALPGSQGANLKAMVSTQLKPFLDSVAPLPGAQELAQARIDRTVLVARGLIAQQGLNPGTAAQQAAKDLTDGYRYVDTWRVPQSVAGGTRLQINGGRSDTGVGVALTSNTAQIRQGAAQLLGQLTANGGAALYAPAGQGGPDDRRKLYALQLSHSARWVSASDDSGLMLMVPHPDGTWDQAADRYGRPVRATWGQLQGVAGGQASPFSTPPATALRVDGQPVAAASKAASFQALSWAVTGKESHFQSGAISSAGALGKMQVMPATVQTYAPRLGLPVDLDRAQHDDAYNQRIGEAALQDHLQHYGPGAGVGLALAAYNAGPGRLDGYRDKATNTWHPGWLQTIGDPRTGQISLTDWAARIPVKETREYVQAVLPTALRRLQSNH